MGGMALVSLALAGCAQGTLRPLTRAADMGTVAQSYPVGARIGDGVEVIRRIPVNELSTAAPPVIDSRDACGSVPAEMISAVGMAPKPNQRAKFLCTFTPKGPTGDTALELAIGSLRSPMPAEVAEHVDMAAGRGADALSHLVWLRIGSHYAIERILASDTSSSCYLTAESGSAETFHVVVTAPGALDVNHGGRPVLPDQQADRRRPARSRRRRPGGRGIAHRVTCAETTPEHPCGLLASTPVSAGVVTRGYRDAVPTGRR